MDEPPTESSSVRADDPGRSDGPEFAARFRRLIQVLYPKHLGRPWTDKEIAAGTGLSATYIGNLRKGTQKPSLDNAAKIAKLFGVPLDYFQQSETARAVERDLERIEQIRREMEAIRGDETVGRIAMRAAGLPPAMKDAALTVVEQLRRAARLPEDDAKS